MDDLQCESLPAGVIQTMTFTGTPEAKLKFVAAIANARLDFGPINKDSVGQYGNQRFRYANLGVLTDATARPLAKQGIVVLGGVSSCPADLSKMRLNTWVLGHGAEIKIALDFTPSAWLDGGEKRVEPLKELGKLETYFMRYQYRALFQLDTEPDADEAPIPRDDGKSEPRREAPRPPSPPARAEAPKTPARAEAVRQPIPTEPARTEPPKAELRPPVKAETRAPAPFPYPGSKPVAAPPHDPPQPETRVSPPVDPMVTKLTTVAEPVTERLLEFESDQPTDEGTLRHIAELMKALEMGKTEFWDVCEKQLQISREHIRPSLKTARTVERHLQNMLDSRSQGAA